MTYSNLPISKSTSGSARTVDVFNEYFNQSIPINYNDLSAMTAFFRNKGFDELAADNCAIVILTQASQDGYEPMQLLDTLGGLESVEISGLVAEILNFNRINTSLLGTTQTFSPSIEVSRQIIA